MHSEDLLEEPFPCSKTSWGAHCTQYITSTIAASDCCQSEIQMEPLRLWLLLATGQMLVFTDFTNILQLSLIFVINDQLLPTEFQNKQTLIYRFPSLPSTILKSWQQDIHGILGWQKTLDWGLWA